MKTDVSGYCSVSTWNMQHVRMRPRGFLPSTKRSLTGRSERMAEIGTLDVGGKQRSYSSPIMTNCLVMGCCGYVSFSHKHMKAWSP